MIQKIKNTIQSDQFKKAHEQFIKFIIVGIWSTIVNYGIFYVLLDFVKMNYLLSSAVGFISGVFAGYELNKQWTYGIKEKVRKKVLVNYYFVYILSLILSLIFLKIAVGLIGIDARIANIFAIGITTCTNFLGTKLFVFKK
jgi:putative flippase GtrA